MKLLSSGAYFSDFDAVDGEEDHDGNQDDTSENWSVHRGRISYNKIEY